MKTPRLNSCNVLSALADKKHLWQFAAEGSRPVLAADLGIPAGKPVPAAQAGKSWRDLVRPRLNIAWLPAAQVFLRVIQLPKADAAEIGSMLEFQLEKLSPLPVAQIAWSFELIPSKGIDSVTAVVLIVERGVVEARLGELEKAGYQADRLELPELYQLATNPPEENAAWIHPVAGAGMACLVAWWFNGTLQNLQLLQLPSTAEAGPVLRDHLRKSAWAGEMEGWLTFPMRWRLAADEAIAAEWLPLLRSEEGEAIEVRPVAAARSLAEFAAQRALAGIHGANLIPAEFSVRFRQEFMDRLWMRGLGAAMALYLAGLLAYFLAVQGLGVRQRSVEKEVRALSGAYTNSLRLKERVQVLQDQLNLKYAALDSWKAASDLLPAELTLTWMVFGRGQTLDLHGTVAADKGSKLSDYNDALRGALAGDQPLFKSVSPPTSSARPGSPTISWSFSCELNQAEIE